MSTVSINCDDKKVRHEMDSHILHTFILVVILLFIIAIICYHYTSLQLRSKQKDIGTLTIKKTKNNKLKKFVLKYCTCHYSDDIIKIENCDFDNILLDEKSYEIILI